MPIARGASAAGGPSAVSLAGIL